MPRAGFEVDGPHGDRRERTGPARPALAEAVATDSRPAPRVTAEAGGRSRLRAEALCWGRGRAERWAPGDRWGPTGRGSPAAHAELPGRGPLFPGGLRWRAGRGGRGPRWGCSRYRGRSAGEDWVPGWTGPVGAGWGRWAHSWGQGPRFLSPALAPRMGSSSLSEDYRQCLERELRRGRAGVCGDPSLRAVLWQILVEDFDLHGALQDDALALLTDGLWGRADLAPALRGLARAFELLELAAVHLYLLPWRKEFTTIKVGAGDEGGAFLTRRGGEGFLGSSAPGLGAQSALRGPACVGSAVGRGPRGHSRR